MFERFTDRACKIMALANQEAQRFNHEYIDSEHILLGLVKEGCGVGASVLKQLDIDLRKVRLEVEKLLKSGPEMVTMGKLPQTPAAKKVIEYAIAESRDLNHNYVGSEHLLLGLLREHNGIAAHALRSLGVSLESARQAVTTIIATRGVDDDGQPVSTVGGRRRDAEPPSSPEVTEDAASPFTSRLRVLFELAVEEAQRRKHSQIVIEHVLTVMLRQESGAALQVLHDLEVNDNDLRTAIRKSIPLGSELLTIRPSISPGVTRVLAVATDEARALGDPRIGTGHFLLAVLSDQVHPVTRLLSGFDVSYKPFRAGLKRLDASVDRGDAMDQHVSRAAEPVLPEVPEGVKRAFDSNRFTDRARRVIALATQEAVRLNHGYISTEHVLLGLIREGTGVGANVLKNLELDLYKVRREIERLVRPGPEQVAASDINPTPRTICAINFARDESRRLGHNYVGTEHLVLGLLREQEGVAAQVLVNLGLKLEEVRGEVLNLLGAGLESDDDDTAETPTPPPETTESAIARLLETHDAVCRDLIARKDREVAEGNYESAAELREQLIRRTTSLSKVIRELLKGNASLTEQIIRLIDPPGRE